jgi:hypothetical protein
MPQLFRLPKPAETRKLSLAEMRVSVLERALSSVVEHYLHTIKTAILAIFSYLSPAFILVASA